MFTFFQASHPEEAEVVIERNTKLRQSWEQLTAMLQVRDAKLEEAGDLHRFLKDLDHFQAWLTKTESGIANEDSPSSLAEAEKLLRYIYIAVSHFSPNCSNRVRTEFESNRIRSNQIRIEFVSSLNQIRIEFEFESSSKQKISCLFTLFVCFFSQHQQIREEIDSYTNDYSQMMDYGEKVTADPSTFDDPQYMFLRERLKALKDGWEEVHQMWENRQQLLSQSLNLQMFNR